jgi:serine/threonine-protein kinase
MVAEKYRLDALIGEGGMGSVWAATHLGLNQVVAIKFVSREFVRSAEALRRFDSEAKAAAQLRSRHVVQVYDTGTLTDGTPYIAMELLHGETLQSRVHGRGPIPLGEAVEILTQCCKALARAHSAGIIHRDIKPDNIFLTQPTEDEGSIVKILDFGIAKMSVSASDQGSKPGATRTGAVLGTPLYMSPEQARALRTLDQRTDLYSLGLVAYTMFTGNLAFSSESFGDLLFQICTAPLPSLCAQASWLPPSMEGWFQRACAREPQDRYTTALEFADGLRVAAGMTLQQRGPSMVPSQRVSGAVSSRETPALASAPSTGPGISRTDDPVGPPPGTSKLRFGLVMAGAALVVVGGAAIAAVVINRNASPPVRAAASDTTASSSDASPANPASNPATNTAGAAPTAAASPLADASAPTADAVPSLAKTAAQVVAPTEPQASHAPPAHTSSHKNTPPAAAAPTAKGAVDLGY